MMTSADAKKAHDQLLVLGEMTVQFAEVHRSMLYPDGHLENDAEHSFHLALSATEIAAQYHPELDCGLISQFSIVHDLAEIYAGDVPTYKISPEQKAAKEKAEKAALARLLKELPVHTAQLLKRYEAQKEPEARFVRLIDKLLPAVIHAVATKVNQKNFLDQFNLKSRADIDAGNVRNAAMLQAMFPEFDFVHIVRDLMVETARDRFFPE